MTAPQGFTAFLAALQHATSYHGLESFHELGRDDLPAERTIYRWQQAVGENLIYFPSISWGPFGLTHAHLFITGASDEWFTFPFAIDAAWLARSPVERVLYLHCLVPSEHESAFTRLLDDLRILGIAATINAYFTGDSWQDHDEPRRPPLVPHGSALPEHAFLIPVSCENQERRLSLHDLWTTVYARLGHRAWFYLPRQRRLKTNGKRYVKQAFAGMNQAQLFRQLITRNRLDLEMNVEIFLLLDPAAAVDEIAVRLQAHSISVEHAVGRKESLVRALGGVRLLYAIMALPERLTLGSTGFLLDRNRTLAEPTRVRFCYELLFNPNQAAWLFPRSKILEHMHLSR